MRVTQNSTYTRILLEEMGRSGWVDDVDQDDLFYLLVFYLN